MRRFENYSAQALRQVRKFELFSQISDCSEIDDHELDSVLFELARRLGEKTTQRDKTLFFLLACSADLKQINFGTGMLTDFVPPEEAIKYWVAISRLARTPSHQKNVARSVARTKIQRFFDVEEFEELETKLQTLEEENNAFITQMAQAMMVVS